MRQLTNWIKTDAMMCSEYGTVSGLKWSELELARLSKDTLHKYFLKFNKKNNTVSIYTNKKRIKVTPNYRYTARKDLKDELTP